MVFVEITAFEHFLFITFVTGSSNVVMKRVIFLLIVVFLFGACKARHSFNSVDGKKKLKHYNSIQHRGYPSKKRH